MEVEEFVEPDVGQEVQRGVEEGEQSDHAAHADQPVLAGDAAQGRDGEGGEDEDQRPVAGRVGDDLDGIGAQAVVKGLPDEAFDGDQRGQEDDRFREP